MKKYFKVKFLSRKHYLTMFLFLTNLLIGQEVPADKIIKNKDLVGYLKKSIKENLGNKAQKTDFLAKYFREKFSERYYYDWQNVDARFNNYKELYGNSKKRHKERAEDHMQKYDADSPWKLPFNYKNGKPVNAYALRHLARQHKMVDIAYQYHYENKEEKYLNYFTEQVVSLNKAFASGDYEKIKDGNGVYEAFRSGYRVLNWLQIHNLFLGEPGYSDDEQLKTIATLLQHGAHLYQKNLKFHSGNHQTRGLSALAMLSIIFCDFEGTEKWYAHAMNLLEEHLRKEINEDGFQFERTVHYHMSDIGNYYYVYQLAKKSNLPVKKFWKDKLESLFTSLIKIAYPNKHAPVLSDDTDEPWAERNDISGALTLGYLLFESPEFGYFANKEVPSRMFWYVTDIQLKLLQDIKTKKPTIKSTEFTDTGYYIMRKGWEKDDEMLIISAGLDDKKPDHQHGDMLGIQAMANGKVILPNYQVRYSLKDLELFKNSMTKNVALVDDELQGKKYKSNKGGSGFGKFKQLPMPNTIVWSKSDEIELFVGSHDGFENVGVSYSRQVVYIKEGFWIIKDNFKSEGKHEYKQVWQGHYTLEEGSDLIRSNFDNATGLDIFQLNKVDTVKTLGSRGKEWSIVSKKDQEDFSFITVLYPYKGYGKRINENKDLKTIKGWNVNEKTFNLNEGGVVLSKENKHLFFKINSFNVKENSIKFSSVTDVYVKHTDKEMVIQNIGEEASILSVDGIVKATLKPGGQAIIKLND